MRVEVNEHDVSLWLSARDTYAWANKTGASWPCSTLSSKTVFAQFDRNGLVEYRINGKHCEVDGPEFDAITSDHLKEKLHESHPAYFVAVGQFRDDYVHKGDRS